MLETILIGFGLCLLVVCLLCLWFLVAINYSFRVIVQSRTLQRILITEIKAVMFRRLKRYFQGWKRSKRKTAPLRHRYKKLILCGMSCVLLNLLLPNNTAFCQTDTLTSYKKDSVVYFLPFIIADLQNYDLLKQKTALQEQRIKGLQAITQNQKNVSLRQNLRLESYSNTLLGLQSENSRLKIDLKSKTKKAFKRGLENWIWRGGATILTIWTVKQFYR